MSMNEVFMAAVVFFAIFSIIKNFTDFLLKRKVIKAGHFDNAGILDQKVSYSALLYELADSMPEGVVIDTLDLDSSTFGSAMTINAKARTFESASQLKDKLSSNTEVFSDVKLLSLESAASGDTSEYPVKVSVSVVINKAALQ